MKNNYSSLKCNKKAFLFLQMVFLLGMVFSVNAQVMVPFTQRTSQYTPTKKIYNIKGDFTMLGNTNLTLQNYGATTNNNSNTMVYVDVDGNSIAGLNGSPTFNSSAATLNLSTENGAVPSCSRIVYAGLYWTGRADQSGTASNTFSVTKTINGTSYTKNFDKKKIMFKGPSASAYTQFTATSTDIYYPTTSTADYIYSSYAEVTDYVRQNGIGQYLAADIALRDGNGGGTGYSGGWGLIVVYENSKMKYRDVTIFDGHAYIVASNTSPFDLPVSGFNTVQTGTVGVKLGMMASEGDVGLTGDYFSIRKNSDNTYLNLNDASNSTTNFFNSTINTGGNSRNPNLTNNTGIDIHMFNVPNVGNAVLGNNQTSTNFRYGTGGDTYAIFSIAMAVDAYIPEIPSVIQAVSINNVPVGAQPYVALPGDVIEYNINVYNRGSEATSNTKITIPIPYAASFVSGSILRNINFSPAPVPNNAYFDPLAGGNGSIIWDISTLPLPADPNTILGSLKFKFKVTEDCAILKNQNCSPKISIYGNSSGVGVVSGVNFTQGLIQGYSGVGACQGEPITDLLTVNINATNFVNQNCQNTDNNFVFYYCNISGTIPVSQISGTFPSGTRFYNQFPITASTIEYTDTNPFPGTVGTLNYYAVPPFSNGCYFVFSITVVNNYTVTFPANYSINSCSTSSITGLSFSTTPVQISQQQFISAGGTITNGSIINSIFYVDTISSGCPKIVSRVFTINTSCINATSTHTQLITLLDTTAPVIAALPATSTISCPATPSFATATATDACGSSFTLTFNDVTTNGQCSGSYSVTRTWTATDSCGNVSTASQTINVIDTTAPVIAALPATSTISCPATPSFAT
ncbi:MAG: hypothetical protein K2P85_05280, partial [Flavobacteriaceae bacterium]|nr:hypothetical protein [Flavobacteriaceae bacterium]